MALSYSKSCLIGALMETMAYGLYIILFFRCLRILYQRHVKGRLPVYLLLVTLVLFVLITMRMVLDSHAAVEAFTYAPTTPNAAEAYYGSFGNGAMFRTGTYVALTIVADIFIVYRVYAIWSSSLIATTLPFLLAIADIVSGALTIQSIRDLAAGSSPGSSSTSAHILIFYGFTLGLNVLSSFLIAFRIWLAKRQTKVIKSSMNLNLAIEVVIESGALYSACLVALIVPTALESNVQYCLLSMMPGVVGIAFSLIIVRVTSGLSPDTVGTASGTSLRFAHSTYPSGEERSHFPISDASHTDVEDAGEVQLQISCGSRSLATGSRSDIQHGHRTKSNQHQYPGYERV